MPTAGIKLLQKNYLRSDPVFLAKYFLGKSLLVRSSEGLVGGMIYETEAYGGAQDKASHAYNNRRTKRTEVMFGRGGKAYVYLCYGIHYLFNIVTGLENSPEAVLIRGVKITEGIDLVAQRRRGISQSQWASGPGKVTLAMGINLSHQGCDLTGDTIWIEDRGIKVPAKQIQKTARIGVDYAGEWAEKPWRFVWNPDSF